MEKVIYNSRTKEISREDLSTKVVQSTINGKVVKGYNGWQNAILYTADELREIGKPAHYSVPIFVKLDDNSIEQIASGFYQASSESDRQREKQTPWFGKTIPLAGKNGSQFRILDLETGNIVYEKENSGDIYLIDNEYYEIYDKDWSAFDVIGAFDDSTAYLKRNGITVFRTSEFIRPQYKEGKLDGLKVGNRYITKDELDSMYAKKVAANNLQNALEDAAKAGLKPEDITKMISKYMNNKNNDLSF